LKRIHRRLVGAFVAGLVALLASVFAMAPPASAHRDGACNTKTDVCVWEDHYQDLGRMDYAHPDDNFQDERYFITQNPVNDSVSSVVNYNWYCDAWFFRDKEYNNFLFNATMYPTLNHHIDDLNAPPYKGVNDQASSFLFSC
jgi:hypothetical protein